MSDLHRTLSLAPQLIESKSHCPNRSHPQHPLPPPPLTTKRLTTPHLTTPPLTTHRTSPHRTSPHHTSSLTTPLLLTLHTGRPRRPVHQHLTLSHRTLTPPFQHPLPQHTTRGTTQHERTHARTHNRTLGAAFCKSYHTTAVRSSATRRETTALSIVKRLQS